MLLNSMASEAGGGGGRLLPGLRHMLPALSALIGMGAVGFMALSILYEIILRTVFGQATSWVTEVSGYLVVLITFASAEFAASRNAHVRMSLLTGSLSAGLADSLRAAMGGMVFFLATLLLWQTGGFVTESFHEGTRSWGLMTTPLWLPQSGIVLGLLMLCIGQAVRLGPASGGQRLWGLLPLTLLVSACLSGTGLLPEMKSPHLPMSVLAGGTAVFLWASRGARPALLFSLAIGLVLLCFWLAAEGGLGIRAIALVAVLLGLLALGLPVAFALMATGMAGMLVWLPPVSLGYSGERSWQAVNTFELAAIPMFVLMGALLARSDASTAMFSALAICLGRLRGGLAHASILASGLMAAVSGSSLATAATMGRVAGPEMTARGYSPRLTYGTLAAGGTLGILIPPSIAMIVYGPIAGVPVTQLFMAGILPGLLMILAFSMVVALWTIIAPKAAPAGEDHRWRDKARAMIGVLPFLLLILMVLGALYLGWATPTEAGAVGAGGALLITGLRGGMSWNMLREALEEAALVTSFLLMIAVGASIFGFVLDFLSMPQALVRFVEGLGLAEITLFLAVVLVYLLLGTVIEPISMVLMTLPVILPLVTAMGWDPLWFGVILVMLVEVGLVTPPVGMILYVLAGVARGEVGIGEISSGAVPFVLAFLAMIFLFFLQPALVTSLPEMLR